VPRKAFDCVAMKLAVQRRLAGEQRRAGDAAFRRATHDWLSASPDPLAVWWRDAAAHGRSRPRLAASPRAQDVAEAGGPYAATPKSAGKRRQRTVTKKEHPTS